MSALTKIATNSPFSFSPASGFHFSHLGEGIGGVSLIIIMLPRNFGGNSIPEINALTHWLSMYPSEVPCLLAGCETKIPDRDVNKYRMKERDDAIRALCDEVLRRSKSIGVRGEISKLHMTQLVGYEEDQIDVLFGSEPVTDRARVRSFLAKNGFVNESLDRDILAFQRSPTVMYERPITFDRNITIHSPYIDDSGSHVRLVADVSIDGKTRTLWCQTSHMYRRFLLSERADAFLAVLLPLAMRTCKDIVCEAPVTEHFLHNLREILVPQLSTHDTRLYRTQINAVGDASTLLCGNAVATGMSCGVDSFYTAGMYKDYVLKSMALTHLYTGNYLYGNEGIVYERAILAADGLALPLVCTGTNINEELKLPHLFTHFFKTMFGVLALRKLFRTYYYSTTEDFSYFRIQGNATNDTALIELLLLYTFSCPDFQVVTGGVKNERPEKTRAVGALPTARKLLNVCLYPDREKNCGHCEKCVRTLLTIDMLKVLDSFQNVFDVEEYRSARLNKFVYLVEQKNSPTLGDVYQHFLVDEPLLLAQAEDIYIKNFKGDMGRVKLLAFI